MKKATEPNKDLVYKNKSNNMGIYLGTIANFNNNKGHISFTTVDTVSIGDRISVENKKHETATYTISELMINDKNVPHAYNGDKIKIGRMKGDISVGDKIYKISDKSLSTQAIETLSKELRKIDLNSKMIVKRDCPIELTVSSDTCINSFDDRDCISVKITSDIIPVDALNSPISKERLIAQLSKTNNTPFQFKNIEIDLDDGLYIPSISGLNELRRQALAQYEDKLIESFRRTLKTDSLKNSEFADESANSKNGKKISLLLNVLNQKYNYTDVKNVDKVYIPFKYFILKDFSHIIENITKSFDTYIYIPTVMRTNYNRLITNKLPEILDLYRIRGFVISNIGNLELLKNYRDNYEFICNYTLNIFNNLTINELNCDVVTLSPELNKSDLQGLSCGTVKAQSELVVYGRTPLMNSNYCLLGKTNKCYTSCEHLCNSSASNKFYLKDRLGFLFRVIPDNIDTVTTIYNSKITSFEHSDVLVDSVRIDILDETLDEIDHIIRVVRCGNRLEGNDYTNRNFEDNF